LEGWLTDLDSPQFAVRRNAERNLRVFPDFVVPHLQRTLKRRPSLEVQRRVERLLRQTEQERKSPTGARIRGLRAVAVLESIASPAARAILQSVTAGAPEAALTQEARASLTRLARQALGRKR
jgi:hypothetical protein